MCDFDSHFVNKEMEAQRNDVICPSVQRKEVVGANNEANISHSTSWVLVGIGLEVLSTGTNNGGSKLSKVINKGNAEKEINVQRASVQVHPAGRWLSEDSHPKTDPTSEVSIL